MQIATTQKNFSGWLVMLVLFAGLGRTISAPPALDRGVSLVWDASPSSSVVGYKIYYGTASGNYPNAVSVQETTATITNLTPGETYYFAVTAFDANGLESEFSNEIQFLVPGSLTFSKGGNPGEPMLMKFSVAPSHSYEVQATTDFQTWTTIFQTGVVTSNEWVQFSDPESVEMSSRFYRLVLH